MSHQTITDATRDAALQDRVMAAASKEAWANPEFGDTPFGQRLMAYPTAAIDTFMWPVAIDYEDEYAYALGLDPPNPNPGGDPGVITDANISAAVQAHWPVADALTVDMPLPPDMAGTMTAAPLWPEQAELVGPAKGPTTEPVHTAPAT